MSRNGRERRRGHDVAPEGDRRWTAGACVSRFVAITRAGVGDRPRPARRRPRAAARASRPRRRARSGRCPRRAGTSAASATRLRLSGRKTGASRERKTGAVYTVSSATATDESLIVSKKRYQCPASTTPTTQQAQRPLRQPDHVRSPECDRDGPDRERGEREPEEDEHRGVEVDAGDDHRDEAPRGREPRDGEVPAHLPIPTSGRAPRPRSGRGSARSPSRVAWQSPSRNASASLPSTLCSW